MISHYRDGLWNSSFWLISIARSVCQRAFSRGKKLVCFGCQNRLPVPEHRNWQQTVFTKRLPVLFQIHSDHVLARAVYFRYQYRASYSLVQPLPCSPYRKCLNKQTKRLSMRLSGRITRAISLHKVLGMCTAMLIYSEMNQRIKLASAVNRTGSYCLDMDSS